MGIQIEYLVYNGNNIKFLEAVIEKLGERSTGRNILYRASEQESLEKILKYGTDRGGFPGRKLWGRSEVLSRELLHEDVIFATTEEEIRYGEQNPDFQTSLRKFSLIEHPLLLAYDSARFTKIGEKQYAFKNPKNKLRSLIAVFVVGKPKVKPEKSLYVVTGAYDCGKTATLEFLRDFYGYNIQKEAASSVLDELGSKKLGHNLNEAFKKIHKKGHVCPACTPLKFAKLALKKQKELEKLASEGSFIERGYIDAAEFFLRISGKKELPFAYRPEVEYAHVFLFDVMPSLQVPKWGKSLEERLEEAKEINKTLFGMYSNKGYDIFVVPAGSVQERAKTVHEKVLMLNRQQENT